MGVPDYERVQDEIKAKIAAGEWRPGDRLPPIRKLAEMFGCGQTTVKTAVAFLRRAGVLRGKQGKAIFVADGHGG